MTHSEFIDFYIKIKRMSVTERTAAEYEYCLRRYLPLRAAVSDFDIYAAQSIMFDINNMSYGTMIKKFVILNQYCKYAVKYGHLIKNPFHDVERPRNRNIDSIENKVYSGNELKVIFNALSYENIFWQAFITLALDSGARRGEILALKWCDLDFDQGYLHIASAIYKMPYRDIALKEPKGRRSRTIKITDNTISLLRKLCLRQKENCMAAGIPWLEENFIFGAKFIGISPISLSTVSHWWHRFLRRCGLPPKRFHDIRHTCATLLLDAGVDVVTVKNRLGHAALSTTMLYLHNDSEEIAASAMSEIIKKAATTT